MSDHRDYTDKVSDKSANVPFNLLARYFVQIYTVRRGEKNIQTADRSLDRRASIFDGTVFRVSGIFKMAIEKWHSNFSFKYILKLV